MSGLDTRGFMDGALRGFDVMDRHYDRQDRKEYREQSLRQAEADRRENRRRYDQQQVRLGELDDMAKEKHVQSLRAVDAQIEANMANKALSEYRLTQTKRTSYLKENMPLIQASWDKWQKTGEVEPILDNEHVKGGIYDVRRYNPTVMNSYRNLEVNMPKVLSREADPDSLVNDLDVIYRKNLELVVGQTDASGKTIAKTRLAKVNQVTDIDPNRAGDQPGLVLGMEVFYEDGSSGGIRPVTQGRSTNPDDNVMVIPLETAMRDLTGQLKLARQAAASPYYDQLFTSDEQRKASRQAEKDYRKDIMGLQLGINKSVEKGDITPEQGVAMLKNGTAIIMKAHGKKVDDEPKPALYETWAGDDNSKKQFITALQQKGQDLSNATPEHLQKAYLAAIEKNKELKNQALLEVRRASYMQD